ncbi:hypothetical protein SEVIR_7G047900v4 [Setaria viridis]|uniref:Uncharacterized protein n=1 Tax=Setaria viridis TaxID=4556 RepID=A0A4V6D3Q8_SETVI|nr:hypothetical protein SEVIR_7G047900v2 [Setaria viridis]
MLRPRTSGGTSVSYPRGPVPGAGPHARASRPHWPPRVLRPAPHCSRHARHRPAARAAPGRAPCQRRPRAHPSVSRPPRPDRRRRERQAPAAALFPALIVAFDGLRGPLYSWVRAQSDGPDRVVAIISCFFCGWTQSLAAELGVPRFVFSPCAVFGTAVLQSLFRRMPRHEDEDNEESPMTSPDLPGAPAFPWRQMSALYRTFKEGDDVSEGLRSSYLWNTFRGLQERYLEAPLADLGFRAARADFDKFLSNFKD